RSLEVIEQLGRQGRFRICARDEYRAAVEALDGNRSEAVRQYTDVMRRLRDRGSPAQAAMAALELVALVGAADPQVAAAADEARAFWTKMGATALLERLDEAIARGAVVPAATAGKPAARPAAERVSASPQP